MKKSTFFTKVAIMLLVIFLVPTSGFSNHFISLSSNGGNGSWNVYISYANILGVTMDIGDEVALFDGNICVGTYKFTSEPDTSYNPGRHFFSYPTHESVPGYTFGGSYIWKCYDASSSIEYTGTMVYYDEYGEGQGNNPDYLFPLENVHAWSWVGLNFNTIALGTGDVFGNITETISSDDIQGVTVTATGSITYTDVTDTNGDYSFDDINVDTYTLSTSHPLFVNESVAGINLSTTTTPIEQNFVLDFKTGFLEGYIKDQDGDSIVGAQVIINGLTATTTDGVGTKGYYYIAGIDSGYYDATASKTNYASSTIDSVLITPNDTTFQNFTITASGILSGTVYDDNTPANELNAVTIIVVETNDTIVTAAPDNGEFSFELAPGTYSLKFEHTIANTHNGYTSGLVVTAGNITNSDKILYDYTWEIVEGDPFANVWTVYLNNVKAGGEDLNVGDELSVWGKNQVGDIDSYEAIGSANNMVILPDVEGTIIAVVDDGGEARFIYTYAAHSTHSLIVTEDIEIYGGDQQPLGYDEAAQDVTELGTMVGGPHDGALYFKISDGAGGNLQYINPAPTLPTKWFMENTTTVHVFDAGHGLTGGEDIYIDGTADNVGAHGVWNGHNTVNAIVDVDHFVLTGVPNYFISGLDADGTWADASSTVVNSTDHGLFEGQEIEITGSTAAAYDDTYTITNVSTDAFEIDEVFVGDGGASDWEYTGTMAGAFYFTGPIDDAGTDNIIKAFQVVSPTVQGFWPGENFDFRLKYAGSAGELTELVTDPTWETDSGLEDPDTTFHDTDMFSMVNLNFALPPGNLMITFVDEGVAAPDVDLTLSIYSGGIWVEDVVYPKTQVGDLDIELSSGTYSINVTGERFADTTYTEIVITPNTETHKDYVIEHFADETQVINFSVGYQLISRRVDEDDIADLAVNVAGDLIANTNNWLKNDEGNFFLSDAILYPATPNNFGDAGFTWNIKKAYNFYAENNGSITFTGTPLAYNAEITINGTLSNAGNTMISYLPSYALDADDAFNSLKNTGYLDYVRDRDGNSLRKVSGIWVDGIGSCTPNDGFVIVMTRERDTTFSYPAATKAVTIQNNDYPLTHFDFNGGDPMQNVFTLYIQSNDLNIGDEIAAYDGSTLVGAIVITSDDYLENSMPVFSKLGGEQLGYQVGNSITLKAWKQNQNEYIFMNFTNINEEDGRYSYVGKTYPDGEAKYSIIDATRSPLGIYDNLAEYINIYPNPSNGIVNISSPEQIDRISIINIMGQTMMDISPESGNTELNLQRFDAGVYFVNLVIDGHRVTKKLTVQ